MNIWEWRKEMVCFLSPKVKGKTLFQEEENSFPGEAGIWYVLSILI